jgi:inorganic pyrophosphatase
MALLDEGETDWKVLVVDVNDSLAPRLNDIEDVERHLPGLIRATNEWFRIYKIPDGKPEVSLVVGSCDFQGWRGTECLALGRQCWVAVMILWYDGAV